MTDLVETVIKENKKQAEIISDHMKLFKQFLSVTRCKSDKPYTLYSEVRDKVRIAIGMESISSSDTIDSLKVASELIEDLMECLKGGQLAEPYESLVERVNDFTLKHSSI